MDKEDAKMKEIFLVSYSVKGIKALDKLVSLSFYKKTISSNPDTQEYNVKGIYGMNGSGKSGIVTSVDILKNILINPGYLNNPIVQKNLDAIINKGLGALFIEADFIAKFGKILLYFKYELTLEKNKIGKYVISNERLSSRKATSKSDLMEDIFEVDHGKIRLISPKGNKVFNDMILQRTVNLLENTSMCALFYEKIILAESEDKPIFDSYVFIGLFALLVFGRKLHVYLDQSDDHREYFVKNTLQYMREVENSNPDLDSLLNQLFGTDAERLDVVKVTGNIVDKDMYDEFKWTIRKLYEFIHIFKKDLQNIEIDRKEDQDAYLCNLVMVYDSYRIHAEFESTGIKKLIRLYAYLREVVHGGIVFIDEFDSNLHDVYLCALLEYLMSYAGGQLCFTTHNVGPMDILKQHKKSIDFLSTDGYIYPWTTNGNYSPSKLYRNGMIEGSPFNVDSIDFIGIFGSSEEDE